MQIREFMTNDHRACDEQFGEVEGAVNENNFTRAREKFEDFKKHTLRHFRQEEELLFVEFTSATGMTGGPIEVMIYEHNQVRGFLEKIEEALKNGDADEFYANAETMIILLQQHNMKEEQMLYNMIQAHLGARNDELVARLKSM